MVDVIGTSVAGEAKQLETACANLAELLHSVGPPSQDWRAAEAERAEQPVGSLRGACKSSGEDLRVRYQKPLVAAYGRSSEVGERHEVGGVQRATSGEHNAIGHVRCVHAVE